MVDNSVSLTTWSVVPPYFVIPSPPRRTRDLAFGVGVVVFAYSNGLLQRKDPMSAQPQPPNVKLTSTSDYRESYSNSVQVRVSVWDFFLAFGTLRSQTPQEVEVANFQGIYLSPQQAKALLMILRQNVTQYESAFGEIKLDPQFAQQGPVN